MDEKREVWPLLQKVLAIDARLTSSFCSVAGLLLDTGFVVELKAKTRRRHPASNKADMFATVGPDKFTFPSGHASRACFMAQFFIYQWPVPLISTLPLVAWSTAVCVSRLLLKRHNVLDVLAGVCCGHWIALALSGIINLVIVMHY